MRLSLVSCGLGGLLALALLPPLTGCSLVDNADVADVAVDLPAKDFTVDTASWQVGDGAAQTYLATTCSAAPIACAKAAAAACATGCTGSCDADTHTCDLALAVSLWQAVDVAMEQPSVAKVGDATSVQISIDQVTYEVTANSLDLATPELTVYVAPASITAPGAMANAIGTIAPVAAGTTQPATALAFTPTGQAELSAAMSAYETPFNIIVGGALDLRAGDPAPTGKLDARIHITAHAGL